MSTTSNSYVPRGAHQPRGKRPWCATCNINQHLMVESPAVTEPRTDTLVVAVRCSLCGRSRVLETTAEHVGAVTAHEAAHQDVVHGSEGYVHCGEPMAPPGPRTPTTQRTFPSPGPSGLEDSLEVYLATRVLRCRCGFQVELPR